MKIVIKIRRRDDRKLEMATDYKLENDDTPQVHAYGLRLVRALEGAGEEAQQ